MARIVAFILAAVIIIQVAVLGWRGGRSLDPPFQPFMDMVDQPRYDSQSESGFFADRRTQRLPPSHTAAWGSSPRSADPSYVQQESELFALGEMPMDIDRELMHQGQQLFSLYCTVCHGGTGAGNGITTQYGMNAPPSYHIDRIRQLTDGQILQVITRGKGQMGPYGDRIKRRDGWAIVAYIRALQRAQNATPEDVPPQMLQVAEAQEGSPVDVGSHARTRAKAPVDALSAGRVSIKEDK